MIFSVGYLNKNKGIYPLRQIHALILFHKKALPKNLTGLCIYL